MNKQLTQEQIDSLNAIYAKMEDDSLELEFFAMGNWNCSSDTGNNVESRTKNIMICNTPYRIKPEAPKKEYYVVGATELPAPINENTSTYMKGEHFVVNCEVSFRTREDRSVWYEFLINLTDPNNIITK